MNTVMDKVGLILSMLISFSLLGQSLTTDSLINNYHIVEGENKKAKALVTTMVELGNMGAIDQVFSFYEQERGVLQKFPVLDAKAHITLSILSAMQKKQAQSDSLKERALKLNPDSVFYYKIRMTDALLDIQKGLFNKAIPVFKNAKQFYETHPKRDKMQRELALTHYGLGYTYLFQGKINACRTNYIDAIKYLQKVGPTYPKYARELSKFYMHLAYLEKSKGNFFEALEYYMRPIDEDLIDPLDLDRSLGGFYLLSAELYFELNEMDQAKLMWSAYEKFTSENTKVKERVNLGVSRSIGYALNGDWESTFIALEQLRKEVEESFFKLGEYNLCMGYANYYLHNDQLGSAVQHIEKLLDKAQAQGSMSYEYEAYMLLGAVYQREGNPAKSVRAFEYALDLAQQMNNPLLKVKALKALSEVLKILDRNQDLVDVQAAIIAVSDSVELSIPNKQGLFQYMEDSRAKLEQLTGLEKDFTNLQTEANRFKGTTRLLSIIFTIALLLFIGILYWFYRNRKQKELAYEEEMEQFQKNVHVLEAEKASSDYSSQANALKILQLNEKVNELLGQIKSYQKEQGQNSNTIYFTKLTRRLEALNQQSDPWDDFMIEFQKAHPGFLKKLLEINPNLSKIYQKHCICLKMGLSIKETAALLNITSGTVKTSRNRIKKNFELKPEISLKTFLNTI